VSRYVSLSLSGGVSQPLLSATAASCSDKSVAQPLQQPQLGEHTCGASSDAPVHLLHNLVVRFVKIGRSQCPQQFHLPKRAQ
jgi:hypothetical protein